VLFQVAQSTWIMVTVKVFLYATFTFTTLSGVHYVLLTGHRLRKEQPKPAA
jgi:hypothetical protein